MLGIPPQTRPAQKKEAVMVFCLDSLTLIPEARARAPCFCSFRGTVTSTFPGPWGPWGGAQTQPLPCRAHGPDGEQREDGHGVCLGSRGGSWL